MLPLPLTSPLQLLVHVLDEQSHNIVFLFFFVFYMFVMNRLLCLGPPWLLGCLRLNFSELELELDINFFVCLFVFVRTYFFKC